jgi:hypothetical protein
MVLRRLGAAEKFQKAFGFLADEFGEVFRNVAVAAFSNRRAQGVKGVRPWIVQARAHAQTNQIIADIGVSILYQMIHNYAERSDNVVERQHLMFRYDVATVMCPAPRCYGGDGSCHIIPRDGRRTALPVGQQNFSGHATGRKPMLR